MTRFPLADKLHATSLLLTLLWVIALPAQAQITIADDDTELPDYTEYYAAVEAM